MSCTSQSLARDWIYRRNVLFSWSANSRARGQGQCLSCFTSVHASIIKSITFTNGWKILLEPLSGNWKSIPNMDVWVPNTCSELRCHYDSILNLAGSLEFLRRQRGSSTCPSVERFLCRRVGKRLILAFGMKRFKCEMDKTRRFT